MSTGVPLLAAFVSPALFYGGAAAVAAPILIHLLARRRFKRIRWAAMDFLIDAERRNRRRLRMEEWILLALRCLAVLLIALMIGRPFFKPAGSAAVWGGSQRTERVFVLDDSLSMAYETATGTVFGRAKQAVRSLIETIRRDTPDDTVTIIRMTDPTTPVESGTFLDDAQTQELLARLDAMSATQRSIDPSRVIEGVAEVLEQNSGITNAALYFISDFQRGDWVEVDVDPSDEEDGAESGILKPLVAWGEEDRGLSLVLINVCEDDAANLAVTGMSLEAGRLVAGSSGRLRAQVSNYTSRPVSNLELKLTVGQRGHPAQSIRELGANQSASVELEALFPRAGFETSRVELPPDALPADNVRYLATDVASAIRVLLVNGEPSSDSFDDEVSLLATALRPEGEVFSGNEVVVVDETELDDTRLTSFHAIVLANVYRVSDPAVEQLERFVRRGGGVVFFLGDQVDADLYNTAFYRDGAGILPAALSEIVRAPDASHLIVADRLHPAMRGVSAVGDPLGIGQIPFFEYFGCTPWTDEPIVTATEEVQSSNVGRSARVVARFDDPNESPAIVERVVGKGRVVLVTTSADKEWHDWPAHPTFLPIMMELMRHAARLSDVGVEQWVGGSIEIPIDPALYEPDAIVRTPAYPNEREVIVTASADDRGLVLKWEHTEVAGVYQILLKQRTGIETSTVDETTRLVAVNVDPQESNLSAADEDELRRAMGDTPFEYIKGIDNLSGATGEKRTEFWRLLLIVAMIVLMMEQGLAWRWGQRR
jgi:hypothetical protein